MNDPTKQFASMTGLSDTEQRRCLRMLQAALEDDLTQVAAISEEILLDPRGAFIAMWELMIALSVGYARQSAIEVGPSVVLDGIRIALLADSAEGGDNV